MRICKDVDMSDYDSFSEVVSDLFGDYTSIDMADCDTALMPCYLSHLVGTNEVSKENIPVVLEAACYFHDAKDGILTFSVTDREKNHKDWLQAIDMYPGAKVFEHKREGGYKAFFCFVPVNPVLE